MADSDDVFPLSWIDQLQAEMEHRNGGIVVRLQEDREAEPLDQDDAPTTAIGLIVESGSGSVLAVEAGVSDQTGAYAHIRMFNSVGSPRTFSIIEGEEGISVSSY